jgi:hypothetical protein
MLRKTAEGWLFGLDVGFAARARLIRPQQTSHSGSTEPRQAINPSKIRDVNFVETIFTSCSDAEAYERNVLECQLSADVAAESDYPTTAPRHPRVL